MLDPLLLDAPAHLESERLALRVPAPGDGRILFDAISESLPNLRQYLGGLPWVSAEPSVAASEVFCRNAVANFHARKDFAFLVFDRTGHRLVGVCGLHRPDWRTPRMEVGYWCRTSALGRGYITEAVTALCTYAFQHLHAARLEAVIDEANEASRRVAQRSGFALEGILRSAQRAPDGSLRNDCIYARFPADE